MRILVAVLLLACPAPLLAQQQGEDEAHRTDRRQTADLNRSAAEAVQRRDARNIATLERYRAAAAVYERRREAWRRRFDACQGGDDRACDPE
jgi:hypothetical protein